MSDLQQISQATLSPSSHSSTILALDYGKRRVGLAVGEMGLKHAHPLTALEIRSLEHLMNELALLIEQWQPGLLLIGLPLTLEGGERPLSTECRSLALRVEKRFCVPVKLIDERFSSSQAASLLREQKQQTQANPARAGSRKSVKAQVDSLAACLILEDFLGHA